MHVMQRKCLLTASSENVRWLFNREWSGELKKLPNIKLRTVSAKGLEKKHPAVQETHTEEEEQEEDDEDEHEVSQDSDAERLEDKA